MTTLRQAFQRFLENRDLAEGSRLNYERTFQRFLIPFADREIGSITDAEIKDLFDSTNERCRSGGNAVLAMLRMLFNACDMGERNPMRTMRKSGNFRPDEPLRIQPARLKDWFCMLYSARSQCFIDFYTFLLLTGAQRKEAECLRWSDYDEMRRAIVLPARVKTWFDYERGERRKTELPGRVLPLPSFVVAMFKRRKALGGQFIFSDHGKPLRKHYRENLRNELIRETGLPLNPQSLRRTWEDAARRMRIPNPLRAVILGRQKDRGQLSIEEARRIMDAIATEILSRGGVILPKKRIAKVILQPLRPNAVPLSMRHSAPKKMRGKLLAVNHA